MPLGMSRVWSYPTNQGSHCDTPPDFDMVAAVALAIACCVKAWKNIWNKPVNPLYFAHLRSKQFPPHLGLWQ